MKRLAIFFTQIFFISLLCGVDYSFFKYDIYLDCDYFSGESYDALSYFEKLQTKEKVKSIECSITSFRDKGYDGEPLEKAVTEKTKLKKFYNEKGLLVREEGSFRDFEYLEITYNDKGYIAGHNPEGKNYVYISENQRDCYNTSGNFQYRQTIKNENNVYTVFIEEAKGSANTWTRISEKLNPKKRSLKIRNKSVYTYDVNRILKYEGTSYNYMGEESFFSTYDFEYDSDNKIKTVSYTGVDLKKEKEIGNRISTFYYDKDGHVAKIICKFLDGSKTITSEYTNYDEYGNWHNVKTYYQGRLSSETNRTIEYRE